MNLQRMNYIPPAPFFYPMRRGWGLGDNSAYQFGDSGYGSPTPGQANQAFQIGASTAQQTGSPIAGGIAAGLSMASSIFMMSGAMTAACPPCGAALAIGAALTVVITKMIQGCGQTCIDASNYVNEVEPLFVQNVKNYTDAPVRTVSLQAQALANFDAHFQALVQKCQSIGGGGGTNCIKDRTQGSCKWKASPWTWARNSDGSYTYTPAGPNGSGSQCWNWVYGYRDPIALDPGVQPDSVLLGSGGSSGSGSVGDALASITSGSTAGVSNTMLLLGGALILGVLLLK